MVGNRLFCTFVDSNSLDDVVFDIFKYSVIDDKVFIIKLNETNNFICTYSIDSNNLGYLPKNTISIHKKKDYNTLYTINSLNQLIKSLNNNVLDKYFKINWSNYSNKLILSQNDKIIIYNTQLYKIEKR